MMKNHEELSQIKLAAVEEWSRAPRSWGTLGALETSGPCAHCGCQWAAGGSRGASGAPQETALAKSSAGPN